MKVVVFSDSHRVKNSMLTAIEDEAPDVIIHLGDHDKDVDAISLAHPNIPIRCVRGNGDFFSSAKDTDKFMLADKRFFITHGHLFSVKASLTSVVKAAADSEADVLLFGHTHIPYSAKHNNLIVINPGAIGSGRTYAALFIKNGAVEYELKTISG